MPYGIIKIDTVTFTDAGVDKSVSISGLVQNPTFSGNVTVTGTLSGVTVTGTTANFTSGNFTNISGGTHTITSGVFAAGSAASPSITFTGDLNTGIYSPGADQVAISTGGSGRLFVDASGRLGIGTSSPASLLSVVKAAEGTSLEALRLVNESPNQRSTSSVYIGMYGSNEAYERARILCGNPTDFDGNNGFLSFWTRGSNTLSERLRITSAGFVGVGTSSPSHKLDVQGGVISAGNGTIYGGIGYSTRPEIGAISNHDCGFITNNTTRMLLDTSGRLGIGTTSPQELLHVNTGSSGGQVLRLSTNGADTGYLYQNSGAVVLGAYSTRILGFETNGTERVRIDSSGRLLVGTSSARSNFYNSSSYSPRLQLESANDGASSSIALISVSGGGFDEPNLVFAKSRGSAIGNNTIVASGDDIGNISFQASDGSEFVVAANILAEVDGTPGANDMPGRLVFATTADGASSPTERLRITSAGFVGVGTSSPGFPIESKLTGVDSTIWGYNVAQFADATANNTGLRIGTNTSTSGLTQLIAATNSAASQFGFWTYNGSAWGERMRLDSSGQLGIGTTSPNSALQVNSGTNLGGILVGFNSGSSNFYDADLQVFRTGNGTERARIDSSGRLLVGTSSSPSAGNGQYARLVVQSNTAAPAGYLSIQRNEAATSITSAEEIGLISFGDSAGNSFAIINCVADADAGANDYPGRLVFSTTADGASSPTERMRIGANGAVAIGTTDTATGYRLNIDSANVLRVGGWGSGIGVGAEWNTAVSATSTAISFSYLTTEVGKITTTSTATAYVTSSDYRLKENVSPVSDGIARLQQLKPSRFNFIADPTKTVDGFIAHEVQTVVPEAISGEKDAVDADGKPIYQGIDQSKLVPLLTAALQEAITKIESLEARLTAAGI